MEDFELEDLEAGGWERIPGARSPTGIYALVKGGEVVYLAKSKSVFYRVVRHWAALSRDQRVRQSGSWNTAGEYRELRIPFDEVWVFFCPEADLVRMEIEFLERFRPKHNTVAIDRLSNLKVDIHALMAKVQCETKKTETQIPRRSL